jgi:hypothetical protein
MVFISHRGNLNGRIVDKENHPDYIDSAISKGYDVEVDVWVENGILSLGHDKPDFEIEFDWLESRSQKLWIHCKNVESVVFLSKNITNLNYFYHENDKLTLTSKKNIWVFPGNQPINNSIAVLPEIFNDDLSECLGICSDFVERYKVT